MIFQAIKVIQITALENSLLIKNKIEIRNVPCFKGYVIESTRATAQFAIACLSVNLYAIDDLIDRIEKAESDFYQCIQDKYTIGKLYLQMLQ